tara:strand:+ start:879 stop:1040 length:162 start_codon:yes stop_codon:yes gene_type:complete
MFKVICAVAIALNTAMFVFNVIMQYNDWAMLNILSAIACWIPFFNVTGENKDE